MNRKLILSYRPNTPIITAIVSLFLLLTGCEKDIPSGIIGEAIELSAIIPEDSDDLDYVWNMINQPDASIVNPSDFSYNDNRSVVTFIPDQSGIYELEVNVLQYGDQLSVQSFVINIEEGNNTPPTEETAAIEDEWIETEEDQKWLEEEHSEELMDINNPILAEVVVQDTTVNDSVLESTDTIELSVPIKDINEEVEEEIIMKTVPPPPLPKPTILLGSTIPKMTDRFTIQLASKKMLSDAESVAAGLIDDGYDAYIQKAYFKETDEIWYRIRVGSYDSRKAATLVAKVISEKRGMSTWVDYVRFEE